MAEGEDGQTIQVNGIDTEEIKTKIVEDEIAVSDEPLHAENSQDSEVVLDETRTAEFNEVKTMEEEQHDDISEQDELSTQIEKNELNAMELMQQAVEKVEAEDEGGIEEEKPIQIVGEEAAEEQVVEDRTEDQVPDITGTDNADVMATSMDSIEELPTSEEQAIETSALAEQEAELPVHSATDNVEVAPITEAEAPLETDNGAEVEALQKVNETETALKEKAVLAEEAIAVNVEEPQEDDEAKMLPTEPDSVAPEAESEELQIQEAEEAQNELKHTEPLEVVEVIQEVIADESLATNESGAVFEEFSEAEAEETKKEDDTDNERNESDNVELSNEEQQLKTLEKEMSVDSDQKEDENSFASGQSPDEKSEMIRSSRTPSLKPEETNDTPMATPPMTKQEFTFDEENDYSKKSITEDTVSPRKRSTMEEKNPSRKTSAVREEVLSRKVSMEEKVLSRKVSLAEEEKLQSRKTSEVKEKKVPSRKPSVVQEAKAPSRKTSKIEEKVASRKTSMVEEEKIPSRKSSAVQDRVITRKISSEMEEKAPSRKTSKMTSVEEENYETAEFSPNSAGAPVRAGRTKIAKDEVNEAKVEYELEPVTEPEPTAEEPVVENIAEAPMEELKDEVPFEDATAENIEDEMKKVSEVEKDNEEKYVERKSSQSARQIISSPPRRRSPSPIRKRQERSPSPVKREANHERIYKSYDQDTHRQRGPPPRMPSYLSFSSYTPVERTAYSPISPWIQNTAQKYRNDYTAVSTYKSPSIYTSIFDDIVSSGPFSSSLYSTTRLLERSRSRSRELRNALRSKRSTSNYYRYTSNYATLPLRTRDYSTPPLSSGYRSSSRSGSFISFMEYSGQKQYELARNSSRFSTNGLSRASSRSNVDMFYDTGRLSRVDSYVRNLNRNVEYGVPSTYTKYRSPSRPYLSQEYTPINGYRAYNNPLPLQRHSVLNTNPYTYNPVSVSHKLYESRIDELQGNLSREKLARERMKAKHKALSNKLDQACRQLDLLLTNSYSSIRGDTGTYSVYTHNHPYF